MRMPVPLTIRNNIDRRGYVGSYLYHCEFATVRYVDGKWWIESAFAPSDKAYVLAKGTWNLLMDGDNCWMVHYCTNRSRRIWDVGDWPTYILREDIERIKQAAMNLVRDTV